MNRFGGGGAVAPRTASIASGADNVDDNDDSHDEEEDDEEEVSGEEECISGNSKKKQMDANKELVERLTIKENRAVSTWKFLALSFFALCAGFSSIVGKAYILNRQRDAFLDQVGKATSCRKM
jgi:hypothetical protein